MSRCLTGSFLSPLTSHARQRKKKKDGRPDWSRFLGSHAPALIERVTGTSQSMIRSCLLRANRASK
eukprot:627918-Hanusia_phi.AAC.2